MSSKIILLTFHEKEFEIILKFRMSRNSLKRIKTVSLRQVIATLSVFLKMSCLDDYSSLNYNNAPLSKMLVNAPL